MAKITRPVPKRTVAKKTSTRAKPPAKSMTRSAPKKLAKRKIAGRTIGLEPDANVPPILRTEEDEAESYAQKQAVLDQLVTAIREAREAANTERELRTDLTERMITDDDKKVVSTMGTATMVRPESVVYDETKLKKRLGAAMWAKVTTRSLDRNKLDAFIKSGEISPEDVAACADLSEKKPYVKVTPR